MADLSVNSIVSLIQGTSWTHNNNFHIEVDFAKKDFAAYVGWDKITDEILNASLIDVTLPQYQNALISQYVQYEWRFHQGRDELYRFTFKFRDYNQMTLYNTFRNAYRLSKDKYYDQFVMNIKVVLDSDFQNNERTLFQTSTAMIESISQIQLSHTTENQITEFEVAFICNTVEKVSASSKPTNADIIASQRAR